MSDEKIVNNEDEVLTQEITQEIAQEIRQENDYIILHKGTNKRSITWRISVISAFVLTLIWVANTFGQPTRDYAVRKKSGVFLRRGEWRADAYESVNSYHPGNTQVKIIAGLIACAILFTLVMVLYRTVVFQWIYKMPYSKENVMYIKSTMN